MKFDGIPHARLHNQRLSAGHCAKPEDVVHWLGAVQAQEYPGARWALALRMQRQSDADIERAFADGRILRTHVMRPTWHFVTPADIRWMLALTAPRVRAAVASYDRKLGIDAAVVLRSNKAIAAALKGGVELTRQELKTVLEKSGVRADTVQRLAHVVIHAELDGVACSGALRGKQFTYALLDERVPPTKAIPREEALGELARRYFTSRGPAQLQDFVWWSGLKVAEARDGIEHAAHHLTTEVIVDKTYWFSSSTAVTLRPLRAAHLLPLYDEYLIAYKDRSASLDTAYWRSITGRDAFSAPVVLDGKVVGGWKQTQRRGVFEIALDIPARLKRADDRLVDEAASGLIKFLGLSDVPVTRR